MIGLSFGRVSELLRPPEEFFHSFRQELSTGARLLTFFASPSAEDGHVHLTALLHAGAQLRVLRTAVERARGFHSLTRDHPACHIFEREIFEQQQLSPHDHPWLKPVRFCGEGQRQMASYPFYRVDGKEVHEVAVGPIHAGVIEPGHFRFMCLGETVHHLEVQLGYQHRNAERLLRTKPPRALTPIAETLAGDSSVAHAWAHSAALEALADAEVPQGAQLSRAMGLELERIAMHLAGLAGMAADIAFLQGAATYGRLRTSAINCSMLLCGSRFGRGWVRPGGARASMPKDARASVRSTLAILREDISIMNEHFRAARTVRHRLEGVGVLSREDALELGMVGLTARASGVELDARAWVPSALRAIPVAVEHGGDCLARAIVRIREIDASLKWLEEKLAQLEELPPAAVELGPFAPETLVVGLCEGFRGEVIHCVETDGAGAFRHYKAQDPSLRNWLGLALAVRGNDISDFPICNKSFDLSYCGNDL